MTRGVMTPGPRTPGPRALGAMTLGGWAWLLAGAASAAEPPSPKLEPPPVEPPRAEPPPQPAATPVAPPPPPPRPPLTGRGAAKEINGLTALLREAHPRLDAYEPEGDLQRRARRIARELRRTRALTQLRYGQALHRLLAPIGDAHIAVSLPIYGDKQVELQLLPLFIVELAEGVAIDAGPTGLPAGALLLAIDDQPIGPLIDRLSALALVDGRDPAAARFDVARDLPRYYALEFGMKERYRLRYLHEGAEVEVEVPAGGREDVAPLRARRLSAAWSAPQGPPPPRPALYQNSDEIDVIAVHSMGAQDLAAWQAAAYLALAEVDPAAPLLLDLRGNPGGLRPNANAFLDPLVPGPPTPEWRWMRGRVQRDPSAKHGALLWPAGSPNERLQGGPFEKDGEGWRFDGDPMLPREDAGAPEHPGPVLLLVDAGTGSAANGLALALKVARPEVRLVGHSLGGACDRHNGELPALFVGDNSGVAVIFSLIEAEHVRPDTCTPGRGLQPDVPVAPTLNQLMSGRDPWMEAAKAEVNRLLLAAARPTAPPPTEPPRE